MREIKFKVWDKSRKEMLDDVRLSGMLNKKFQCENLEFLQFTGLKDKNGVDVYEGDIVKAFTVFGMTYDYTFSDNNDPTHIYQIAFDDGCFQFKDTKQWSDGSNDWRSIENVELFKVEVIGNIYENPELLKTPN